MTIPKQFVIQRQGRDHVLYAGLLDLAHAAGLKAIRTRLLQNPLEENNWTTIVHAEVELADGRVFSGIGDANEKNVGRTIAPHAIRMAETRAKARALRDALNIGAISLEELGDDDDAPAPAGHGVPRRVPASTDPTRTANPAVVTTEETVRIAAGSAQERAVARQAWALIKAHAPQTQIPPPPLEGTAQELRSWIDTYQDEGTAAQKALLAAKRSPVGAR